MFTSRLIELFKYIKNSSFVSLLVLFLPMIAHAQFDPRIYQHGVDIVSFSDGRMYVIWASSGNPPVEDWIHDIYYSSIDPNDPTTIFPVMIISREEAQEPASSAVSSDNHLMITMEDGWNTEHTIAQRYGVYDADLNPVRAYPQLVLDGGHSGHVAAVANRFIVFYSEGWVDGGGVDDLGSGDEVFAQIYSSNGEFQRVIDVAVGSTRDWWPQVAGSSDHACLVWQRFVDGETYANLMVAIIDPANGNFVHHEYRLHEAVQYYTYNVSYIPGIDRFLILGTTASNQGFSYLLDNDGNIVTSLATLPSGIVRESNCAIMEIHGIVYVATMASPSGLIVLEVTHDSLSVYRTLSDDFEWGTIGSDGVFLDENSVLTASLSTTGLKMRVFNDVVPGLPPEDAGVADADRPAPSEETRTSTGCHCRSTPGRRFGNSRLFSLSIL